MAILGVPTIRRSQCSGFRVKPPTPLVPAEHFAGTCLSRREFAFYGERHCLGDSIDWEANPGTWHWGHDLNRFGFLVLYAEAPNREAATVMLDLIDDWLDKNGDAPTPRSPYAWGNLLNVAIRTENWWRFVTEAVAQGHLDPNHERTRRIAHAVVRQTVISLRLIRRRGFHDNWSIIGLRSVLYILYAIEAFPLRRQLSAIGHSYLKEAIRQQVLPDGVQQELSPHYHWVALELITSIRDLAREAGDSFGKDLDGTVAEMTRFLEAVMSPSGAIVSLGDSDADYGPRIRRYLDSQKSGFPTIEAGVSEPEVLVFPYAGLVSVRHRTTGSLLVFDGGPYGTGHQHEDALGLWLCSFGSDLLIDPGRFLYEKGPETFYAFLKSTAAHSTIRIDRNNQNAHADPTRWRRDCAGAPTVEIREDEVVLTATFSGGYGSNRIGVEHRRQIAASNHGLLVCVRDTLVGEGAHHVEQFWQVSPGPWRLNGRTFCSRRGKAELELTCSGHPGLRYRVAEGQSGPYQGWFSRALNVIEPSPTLIVEGEMALPVTLETVIRVRRTAYSDGDKI